MTRRVIKTVEGDWHCISIFEAQTRLESKIPELSSKVLKYELLQQNLHLHVVNATLN